MMIMRKINTGALLALVAAALAASAPALAQQTQQAGGAAAENTQDMQAITREMQTLKSRYADEVRKLRELEIRLQALTARVQAQEGVARVAGHSAGWRRIGPGWQGGRDAGGWREHAVGHAPIRRWRGAGQ